MRLEEAEDIIKKYIKLQDNVSYCIGGYTDDYACNNYICVFDDCRLCKQIYDYSKKYNINLK